MPPDSITHEETVDLLLDKDLISDEQIEEAKVASQRKDLSILDALMLCEFIDESEVQQLVCNVLGIAETVLFVEGSVTAEHFNRCPLCNFRIKSAYDTGHWDGVDPKTGKCVYGSIYGARCDRCFNRLIAIDIDREAVRSLRNGLKDYQGNIRWRFGDWHE